MASHDTETHSRDCPSVLEDSCSCLHQGRMLPLCFAPNVGLHKEVFCLDSSYIRHQSLLIRAPLPPQLRYDVVEMSRAHDFPKLGAYLNSPCLSLTAFAKGESRQPVKETPRMWQTFILLQIRSVSQSRST